MLSSTAASLYWMGRYVERAEFTAQLVEATLRLDALAARPAGNDAWTSALAVTTCSEGFAETGARPGAAEIARFLLLSSANPNSIRSCIEAARANARAVRTALSREAWLSINRAWIQLGTRRQVDDTQAMLALIEEIKAEARGFEGALHRMLRNEAQFMVALGAAIERANGTARLLDVKYHLLLPAGEPVGGAVDRDQWTGILRTVSAVTAYRWLFREGLKPWLVAELLVLREELPRSLVACVGQIVANLTQLAQLTGQQGEADRLARELAEQLRGLDATTLVQAGTHEMLTRFIAEFATLDRAISRQFRFG